MNGTALILDFNFTGPGVSDLPKITELDALESSGTLLLLDMTHPLAALPKTVPAHGEVLPNMFAAQAKALGVADTSMKVRNVYNEPSHGRVERTPRGGIHAVQETTQTGINQGFQITLPADLTHYMMANPNHSYYVSQWGRTSVPATATNHSVAAASGGGANSFAFTLGNTVGGGQTKIGVRQADEQAGKPNFRNVGVSNFHVDFYGRAIPPLATWAAVFEVGNMLAGNSGASGVGKHGGQVFYRGYIEDLTVSGRTYADVDALDLALYTKEVLTSGGRYYGDSV